MKKLKFKKWVTDNRPTPSGDLLCKAIFEDDEGNKYDWYPKTHDLLIESSRVEQASEMNKIRRKK